MLNFSVKKMECAHHIVWIGVNSKFIVINPKEEILLLFNCLILRPGIHETGKIKGNMDNSVQGFNSFSIYMKSPISQNYFWYKNLNVEMIITN